MIGHLRGNVLRRDFPTILLDVGGVGYEVDVPLRTFEALPSEGEVAELEIETLVRAESLQLFGFATRKERALFKTLLAVSGIGPRLALAILSGVAPEALARAVDEERGAELERIPGVGKKTARRIILELKDKLDHFVDGELPGPGGAGVAGSVSGVVAEACLALESLGFKKNEAEKAIRDSLVADEPLPALPELIKSGLRQLRGGA